MEGNSVGLITKFATSKKGIDDFFRKKRIIDLNDEKSKAMNLFGMEDK